MKASGIVAQFLSFFRKTDHLAFTESDLAQEQDAMTRAQLEAKRHERDHARRIRMLEMQADLAERDQP